MQELVSSILTTAHIHPRQITLLTDRLSIKYYHQAFTHSSVNEHRNYEHFEQLGDVTVNKFTVWYFHRRFPHLSSKIGVKVVSRLRIKYCSKEILSLCAAKLGFLPFIRNTDPKMDDTTLLEDVFEAFIGVTEFILDDRLAKGIGWSCCYKILESIYDQIPIHLTYEHLFDAKTRLKELFDLFHLGQCIYEDLKDDHAIHHITVRSTTSPIEGVAILGSGEHEVKIQAEQLAAESALSLLALHGIKKHVSNEYKNLEQY
jgi:dsRNA-specific ribonuclease